MVCTSDVPDAVNKLKPACSDLFFSCSPGLGSYPSTPSSSQLLRPGLFPGGGEGLQACPTCSPPYGEFTGLDSRAFPICGVTGSLTNDTELGSPNPAGEARSEFLIKDGFGDNARSGKVMEARQPRRKERGALAGLPSAEAWEVYLQTRPRSQEIAGGGEKCTGDFNMVAGVQVGGAGTVR